MLWLTLYLPHLALESAFSPEDKELPCMLYSRKHSNLSVTDLNLAASAYGIQIGMPLNAAQALCHQALSLEYQPDHEHLALKRLALWAQQYTPVVSLEGSHSLLLEIASSLKLFGGIGSLLENLKTELDKLGYSAGISVAPSPTGSLLLAQSGQIHIFDQQQALKNGLDKLPIQLLDISSKQINALSGMGLRTLQDCRQLPRDGLSKRLGTEILLQLDRAYGLLPEPRKTFAAPEHFHSQVLLPEPVLQVEALLFVLQRLLRELCGFLRARGAGAQSLKIGFIYTHSKIEPLELNLLAPSRDAEHLFKLWQEKLERHHLDGLVEGLELQVNHLPPLESETQDLLNQGAGQKTTFNQVLERLKNRLGENTFQQIKLEADHRPERALHCDKFPANFEQHNVSAHRPFWLLPEPQPLHQDASGPQFNGRLEFIQGPERIESGWWDDNDLRRDYYIARNSAHQTLWVFQELSTSGKWYLHGYFS